MSKAFWGDEHRHVQASIYTLHRNMCGHIGKDGFAGSCQTFVTCECLSGVAVPLMYRPAAQEDESNFLGRTPFIYPAVTLSALKKCFVS